jgi:hypothetical protein
VRDGGGREGGDHRVGRHIFGLRQSLINHANVYVGDAQENGQPAHAIVAQIPGPTHP